MAREARYFVVSGFWEGKKPENKHFLAGMAYDGPHAEERLKQGLIKDALAEAEAAALEASKKAEELKKQAEEQRKNADALKAAAAKRAAGPEAAKKDEKAPKA